MQETDFSSTLEHSISSEFLSVLSYLGFNYSPSSDVEGELCLLKGTVSRDTTIVPSSPGDSY